MDVFDASNGLYTFAGLAACWGTQKGDFQHKLVSETPSKEVSGDMRQEFKKTHKKTILDTK